MESVVFIRGETGVEKTSIAQRMRSVFPAGATIEVDFIQELLHGKNERDASQYEDAF